MFGRRKLLIAAVVLVTLGNSGVLAYALTNGKTGKAGQKSLVDILKKKGDIKNSELKVVGQTQKGQLIGTGQYAFESLAQSKITQGDSAQLVVATHENSGGHFVLALLGKDTKVPADKINSGWTINSIAKDPMWAPGACSSKPTFLLQGKYIFIDDGKTSPDDKYNSYIVFNMATAQYNYFGGNSFTKDQGDKEIILSAVNENDKLVFYVDPVDAQGPLAGNTEGKHSRGSDHGYIIRREVDPGTMKYTDYSLPFTVPSGINVYTVKVNYNSDSLVSLNADGSPNYYDGKVVNNAIEFKLSSFSVNTASAPGPLETDLELTLNNSLANALPNLSKQTPYDGAPSYTAKFGISELGSNGNLNFLLISQRFGGYDTPTIYNQNNGTVSPMTDSQILQSYSNYVPLGVF